MNFDLDCTVVYINNIILKFEFPLSIPRDLDRSSLSNHKSNKLLVQSIYSDLK